MTIKGIRQKTTQIERKIADFPGEIACRLIRRFSVKDDIILDTYLGSGTTTKAIIQLKRNSGSYEIDKKIFLIID